MSYENYLKWKDTPNTVDPVISVVILAYNEAERIIPTIGVIAGHLSTQEGVGNSSAIVYLTNDKMPSLPKRNRASQSGKDTHR